MKEFCVSKKLYEFIPESPEPGAVLLVLMTPEEWSTLSPPLPRGRMLSHLLTQMPGCRAHMLADCLLGTLLIPEKKEHILGKTEIGFYLADTRLYLIGDNERLMHLVGKARKNGMPDTPDAYELLCFFLSILIDEDVYFLQKLEDNLVALEEKALAGVIPDFYKRLSPYRGELRTLKGYYDQLLNLSATVCGNVYRTLPQKACERFSFFADRAEHLKAHVEALREYAMQIREIYSAQLDLKQTKAMNLLTVISAIFLPLTLIAGWYGMNFSNMPELHWVFGYPGVFILSTVIVIIEIIVFKKKGLF